MYTKQSYLDAYCLYIDRCVKENWENDIDPAHYEMEWNHFLPRSVFGNWPIGQYLTLRQHAIASALQTLAFGQKCMCPWHKEHLPKTLLEKSWPIYCQASKKNAKRMNELIHTEKDEEGRSIHAIKCGKKTGKRGAEKMHKNKDSCGRSINAVKGAHARALKAQRGVQLIRIEDEEVFIFESIVLASKTLNIDKTCIMKVCQGKRNTAKGFTATYWDG